LELLLDRRFLFLFLLDLQLRLRWRGRRGGRLGRRRWPRDLRRRGRRRRPLPLLPQEPHLLLLPGAHPPGRRRGVGGGGRGAAEGWTAWAAERRRLAVAPAQAPGLEAARRRLSGPQARRGGACARSPGSGRAPEARARTGVAPAAPRPEASSGMACRAEAA